MSIYATLWTLKFPKQGQDYYGCEWVEVVAQGVPAHIGSPTPGCGYEDGDPYSAFLPPAIETDIEGQAKYMRAIVFVVKGTPKGTERSHQEYESPLLVLTEEEYTRITFEDLHLRICEALRGDGPRVVAQVMAPSGGLKTLFDDGTATDVQIRNDE